MALVPRCLPDIHEQDSTLLVLPCRRLAQCMINPRPTFQAIIKADKQTQRYMLQTAARACNDLYRVADMASPSADHRGAICRAG